MGILKIDQKGIRFLKCSSTRSTSFWTWSTTSRSYVTLWTGKKSTRNTNAATIKRTRIKSLRRRKAQAQAQAKAKAKAKPMQRKELAPTTFSTTSRSYVTPWTGKKSTKNTNAATIKRRRIRSQRRRKAQVQAQVQAKAKVKAKELAPTTSAPTDTRWRKRRRWRKRS